VETPLIPEVLELKKDPNFRTINVGGVFGGPLDMRFELTIFSQHYEASKGFESGKQTDDPLRVSRTLECRLVIDPYNFKTIAHWFTGLLNDFERLYGPIITPEERQQKAISTQTDKEKESSSNAYQ
jgi:hypothetical protein